MVDHAKFLKRKSPILVAEIAKIFGVDTVEVQSPKFLANSATILAEILGKFQTEAMSSLVLFKEKIFSVLFKHNEYLLDGVSLTY